MIIIWRENCENISFRSVNIYFFHDWLTIQIIHLFVAMERNFSFICNEQASEKKPMSHRI